MSNDNIIELKSPEESAPDLLTELLRNGARELISQAVNAELEELLAQYSEQKVDTQLTCPDCKTNFQVQEQ